MARKPRDREEVDSVDEEAVYVRLKKPVVKELNRVGKIHGSKKFVMNRILDAFFRAPESEKEAILSGTETLQILGNQMAEASWSAHSFALKHWSWAVSCYRRLGLRAQGIESQELLAFAQYREGYAWDELGMELRRMALSQKHESDSRWRDYFGAALDCIDQGLQRTSQMHRDASVPMNYNLACHHAHRCQLLVERALRRDGSWVQSLKADLTVEVSQGPAQHDSERSAWNEIGKNWRRLMDADAGRRRVQFHTTVDTDEVDRHADKCLACLSHLSKAEPLQRHLSTGYVEDAAEPRRTSRISWPDVQYFKTLASRDSDLAFIRFDSRSSGSYEEWNAERDQEDWIYGSYKSIKAEIDRLERSGQVRSARR